MARPQPPRRARRGPAPSPAPDQERRGLRVPWRVGLLVALVAAAGLSASRPSARSRRRHGRRRDASVASHARPSRDRNPAARGRGRGPVHPLQGDGPHPRQPAHRACAGPDAGRLHRRLKDPSAGEPYRIYSIPTQIFYDEHGRELTRHQGFLSKEDILATWKRVGYDFTAAAPAGPAS